LGGKGGAGGAKSGAPVSVNLALAARRDVPLELAVNGTVASLGTVELRSQTTSILKQVHIREGQFVQAGQLLFTLDWRSERASVDKAAAQLARDQATLADIERQCLRSEELAAQKFISKGASEALLAQREAQRALIQGDLAALRSAQVALDNATIRAPMAGRVGAINVYPGSLVQPTVVLATVTQIDPVAVTFAVPESHLQTLLEQQKSGAVAVRAKLAQGDKTVNGKLSFIDSAVDPVAGTIRVKAQFDNRDSALWPGQYVAATVTLGTLRDAVVVPLSAIVTASAGKFVYAVDGEQKARVRPVRLLHSFGPQAVVSGLDGGESVVTEGKQNLRPGSRVMTAPALADAGHTDHAGAGGQRKAAR
ncbi:MAG: efflux RND transporter periplasmic adaptor subunit, partial [Burkholderiaceae bacterium]|nr:efflux RND transporter periplasmic adaptor subunit [Burkholderiaceae bacterium]